MTVLRPIRKRSAAAPERRFGHFSLREKGSISASQM
jgi:hypothetical protein